MNLFSQLKMATVTPVTDGWENPGASYPTLKKSFFSLSFYLDFQHDVPFEHVLVVNYSSMDSIPPPRGLNK